MGLDISLREVRESDLPILFGHQRDPEAARMAVFPSREWDAFQAHWARILADPKVTARTILFRAQVAGNIVSWERNGKTLVGYWVGRERWGQGVASGALALFLLEVKTRPLFAHAARHNLASIRVLQKCGFQLCAGEGEAHEKLIEGAEEVVLRLPVT